MALTRVEVRNGQVTDARDAATGQPLLPVDWYEPIDSLFPYAIREAERGALKEIVYHRTFGYPVRISSGTSKPDDGRTTEVTGFASLP